MSSPIKNAAEFVWEVVKIVVLAFAIVIPVRYFLFQPFVIQGSSMEPNFYESDYLIVDELSYRFRAPERGEVIVFKYPQDTTKRFIKRVIGLPGETVEIKDGKVSVTAADGKKITLNESYLPAGLAISSNDMEPNPVKLGDGQYFVMGDNRPYSSDSRAWGDVPQKDIIGRVEVRLWPLNQITLMEKPVY
jgi:signal peptidase I